MFDAAAITGSPLSEAMKYISEKLKKNRNAAIYIFGYSAGGDAAIELSKRLGKKGITVQGLVTFDPHNPRRAFGFGKDTLEWNVSRALNFYQRNEVTTKFGFPYGSNPFLGATISCATCATNPNVDISSIAVHTNAVRKSLENYESEIYSVLGL